MFRRSQKSFYGLTGQNTAGMICYGGRKHNRHPGSLFFQSKQSRFGIEGVKNGFQKKQIYAAFFQSPYLVFISICQGEEIHLPLSGEVNPRRNGS